MALAGWAVSIFLSYLSLFVHLQHIKLVISIAFEKVLTFLVFFNNLKDETCFYEYWNCNLPIKQEAIPVGARSRHFGEKGWSPDFLRMCSTHLDINKRRYDFPTPPPPKIEKISWIKQLKDNWFKYLHFYILLKCW